MNPDLKPLLKVTDLAKHFPLKSGADIKAVDGVSFTLNQGETLSIVGESGCGKSTLARTAIRLYEPTSGAITFDGGDLTSLSGGKLRAKRKEMQMIFQDPFASLDTRQRVGSIVAEPMVIHGIGNSRSRREKVLELLEQVGLDKEAAMKFPHEFSGGQRQRIGIARAVILEPKLVVADEPVSALDVSIQSQILNLLVELRQKLGLSYIFISHDLAVVKHISERTAVMYLGRIVEKTSTDNLFQSPLHPYTEALVSAIPRLNPEKRGGRIILQGDIPDPSSPPAGCRFHPRCPKCMPICKEQDPAGTEMGTPENPHLVYCHLY